MIEKKRKATAKSSEPAEESAGGPETPAGEAPAAVEEKRGDRTLTGRVVSTKMRKTIAVEIVRLVRHAEYGKFIRRTSKVLAHDENGETHEGDTVTITQCRPLSRRKAWRLLEIVERAQAR